jgi:ATP-dependent Clp protease protease subunit
MEEPDTVQSDSKTRVIFLFGALDDEKAGEVVVGLRQLQELGPEPIQIVLCSTGGGETAGWAIYDAIRSCQNHVTVDAIGSVWSMAVVILQAGDLRRMSPECRLMVHAGSAALSSSVDQKTFIALGREARKTNRRYQQVLAKHTGLPVKRMREHCNTESFFSAKEALKLGFVDEITTYPSKLSGAAQ